jgi:hypothetical protein
MSTLEDVFYDFEEITIDNLLNKKVLGSYTPIPFKPVVFEDYTLEPYYEETMFDNPFDENMPLEKNTPPSPKKNIDILKKKYYIRPNQECPICLEPILTKNSAFLTPCGHGFHKLCIHQAFEKNWLTKQGGISCPLCRYGDISDYCIEKYCSWNIHANDLDCLENFWFNKDMTLAIPCYSGHHYIGIDKNCISCKRYRTVRFPSKSKKT